MSANLGKKGGRNGENRRFGGGGIPRTDRLRRKRGPIRGKNKGAKKTTHQEKAVQERKKKGHKQRAGLVDSAKGGGNSSVCPQRGRAGKYSPGAKEGEWIKKFRCPPRAKMKKGVSEPRTRPAWG